jgi:hypothetical protein
MNTFPTLDCGPTIGNFSDEFSDEAVQVASSDSGYPLMNEKFTFDPRTFSVVLDNVSQMDKETLMTFYQNNKSVPFYWDNEQDGEQYEVVFIGKPTCQMYDDDDYELWHIELLLKQVA